MSTTFTIYDENGQAQEYHFKCPECGHDTIEETWTGHRFLPLDKVILWDDHSSSEYWNEEDESHRTRGKTFSCAKCGKTFLGDYDEWESAHELALALFGVGAADD